MLIKLRRKKEYTAMLRSYKIYIDDVYCGKIKNSETKEFNVSNGNHTIYAKIDWCNSNKLNFLVENSEIILDIGSSVSCKDFSGIVKYTFIDTKNYLWIKQADC